MTARAMGCGVLLLLVSVFGGACNSTSQTRAPHPACTSPARHELVSVGEYGWPWMFSTSGGDLYFGVKGFGDGIFNTDVTSFFFGPSSSPPIVPEGTMSPTNYTESADVDLGRLTKVSLPPGRYWVISSNGGVGWIESCPPTHVRVFRHQ